MKINDPSVISLKIVVLQSKNKNSMLDSLHIQNYRLFKDLKIEKLGQVNLIAGKNNSGKTALLEALRILASNFDNTVINNILYNRGDYVVNRESSYSSLFFNYNPFDKHIVFNGQVTIEYHFSDEPYRGKKGHYRIYDNTYPYKYDVVKEEYVLDINLPPFNPNETTILVPFLVQKSNNLKFWAQISLKPEENDVIEILKILDNSILRIAFNNEHAIVLTSKFPNPLPLENLGDGANRLLTLALALVNAKNKMLLIDEFEVGLHHSVQTQLWEIIFKYAKEWNIQVFATTHSLDTVRAFAEVSDKYEGMGEYMRLQKSRTTDDIEAVVYSKKSLVYAIEDSLEMR
jgi:AAA15 family ATPase/GTPase